MHHLAPSDVLSKTLASFKKSMSALSRRMVAFDDVLKVDNRYRDLCPAKRLACLQVAFTRNQLVVFREYHWLKQTMLLNALGEARNVA